MLSSLANSEQKRMTYQMQRCEHLGNLSCVVTVVASIFTILGRALHFLDEHGVAFGVIFGFFTTYTSWYYKRKHFKLAESAVKCETCKVKSVYEDM